MAMRGASSDRHWLSGLRAVTVVLLLAAGAQGFITISGTQFVTEKCTPFVFSGYNTWQILENAAGVVGSQNDVLNQFNAAIDNDFTVVRLFAFGTQAGFALQTSQGQYNAQAFEALDSILNNAAQHSLRLIMVLADNWPTDSNTDNIPAYVSYSSTANGNLDAFYTDAQVSAAYQAHLLAMVNRTNSITGVAYKDDPTIFSWNLINEPRCSTPNCSPAVQSWIEKQSSYLKTIDPNHLVTVGEDGFWDAAACDNVANPGTWAGSTGQSFAPNHAAPGIDYASVHLWPDNWQRTELDFSRFWILNHTADAKTLQKPFVLEEYGKQLNSSNPDLNETTRLANYKLVYFEVSQSFQNAGPLQGVLFWRWDAVTNVNLGAAQGSLTSGADAQTLDSSSPTFQQVILPFSQETAAFQNGTTAVAGCSVTGSVSTTSATVSKPGPSYFAPPDISNITGTFYGYITGDSVGAVNVTSVAQCKAACEGNSHCNAFDYCFCSAGCSAGTVPGGTCLLGYTSNNFYPRLDTTQGSGYVAGVVGATNITQQWLCQPSSPSCTLEEADTCSASDLEDSLQCPSASCNATQVNAGGVSVLTIDVNGDEPGHPVNTTQECCAACQQNPQCQVWSFCPYLQGCDSGCQSYISTAASGTSNPPFGPYSTCDGLAFPFGTCTLKTQPGGIANATIYASGFAQPWVSGGV